ncbi:MAG: DUF4834 domain-containing protein [Cytophagaceae bacterium SCN 52-12]|nr:MAG: DUF4834 domain-containing protein [Cytophagaceae bacterium SCN 52-12]
MKLFFNILLIFFFLIIFVPIFRRFLFHLLVGRQLVKEQKRANAAYRKNPGKVNIDSQPENSSPSIKGGEYIDYEEVKDK